MCPKLGGQHVGYGRQLAFGIGATASWEYNLPPNHYVIAQCALNMFINTTGSSAINVYSYTQSDGAI